MSRIGKTLENNKVKRLVTFIITCIFISGIIMTSLVTKKYDLQEGDIAQFDIKAIKEVTDKLNTEEKQKQKIQSVPLQYNKNLEIRKEALEQIENLFFQANKLIERDLSEGEKIEELRKETQISLSEEEIKSLLTLDKAQLKVLHENLINIMNSVLDLDIREDNPEDIRKAQDAITVNFNSSKLSKVLRDLGIRIGILEIKPNFFYDEEKTNELKTEAKRSVEPITIKKGQIVVKEGEPITNRDLVILGDLGLLDNTTNKYIYVAIIALVTLVMFLQWFYLYKYYKELYYDWAKARSTTTMPAKKPQRTDGLAMRAVMARR